MEKHTIQKRRRVTNQKHHGTSPLQSAIKIAQLWEDAHWFWASNVIISTKHEWKRSRVLTTLTIAAIANWLHLPILRITKEVLFLLKISLGSVIIIWFIKCYVYLNQPQVILLFFFEEWGRGSVQPLLSKNKAHFKPIFNLFMDFLDCIYMSNSEYCAAFYSNAYWIKSAKWNNVLWWIVYRLILNNKKLYYSP